MTVRPSVTFERRYWEAGETTVVGVDEVGRGAWAGPLTVGAVVISPQGRVNGIRDSKELRPRCVGSSSSASTAGREPGRWGMPPPPSATSWA